MTRGSGLAPVMGSTSMIKKSTAANTDGLINCLRQPGLLLNRPPKSMREKYYPLIKYCGTRTVPTAGTESLGLSADALVPCFLLVT